MNKNIDKGSIITSIVLCVILFALGVFTLVMAFLEEKINWISIIVGAFAIVFSIIPIFSSISTSKKGLENAIKQMGVETSPLKIEYVLKEKRIEVKQFKGETVEEETIMFKNVATLKKLKEGLSFYLENGVMYYFDYSDILVGTPEQIIKLFQRNCVKIVK
ncbi:MAG: hypothetical protein J6R29_02200 [Clostridia bacterium]|nr:hypothetical protein [Clostridia bacterium]